MFLCLISLSNLSLVLILHVPSLSFVGPKIYDHKLRYSNSKTGQAIQISHKSEKIDNIYYNYHTYFYVTHKDTLCANRKASNGVICR
jgi:hypothetical protein